MSKSKNRAALHIIAPLLMPGLIDTELLMELRTEADDPGANFTAGQLAQLGDAFSALGEELTAAAKTAAAPHIEGMVGASATLAEDGTVFKWVGPTESVSVDSAIVRKQFPPEDYPDFYRTSRRSAYISITV